MEKAMVAVETVDIINEVNLDSLSSKLKKINDFQALIHSNMIPKQDYGIIPGTPKPTLLKPGAEKICMLMGLRSEFEIMDSTRDFEKGFFQYQIRCKLYRGDMLITEGLGSCNTKENKYVKASSYSVENTVLKMAKKRALVDAALMVGSLSNIFTQDIEDMNIEQHEVKREYTDQDGVISMAQAKRLYAISKGNADLCKQAMEQFGYKDSKEIKKIDYNAICDIVLDTVKGAE